MTGTDGPVHPGDLPERPTEPSPEWSLELLADLRAGVLTERAAARLRPQVDADPQGRTVLAALDATVADLAALPTRCPARMPDAVAQRLDAALAAEALAAHRRAAPRAPVITSVARRCLRARWIGAGVLAAAAMGVVVSGVMSGALTGSTPRAGDALGAAAVSPPAPLALSGGDLGGALNHALGARDYGPLSRPDALRRCLDAHNVPVRDEPLGAREVTLDGRRGVLLVLPTTQTTQFRLLVVGPNCAPGNPAQLANHVAVRR